MPKKTGGNATPNTVAVDTVAKLLRKLVGGYDIGVSYNYTYQGKTVATVDSTKAGRIAISLAPSAWANELAEALWEYNLDEDLTADPTTVDPAVDGWEAVLLTDATDEADEDGNELDADLTEDEIFNGDADTED